jgi:pimeloyl-ACP methyl ester carboxylesterase
LAKTLGIEERSIDSTADLAEYGMDSILFLDFAEMLEKQIGRIPIDEIIAHNSHAAIVSYLTSYIEENGSSPAIVSQQTVAYSAACTLSADVTVSIGEGDTPHSSSESAIQCMTHCSGISDSGASVSQHTEQPVNNWNISLIQWVSANQVRTALMEYLNHAEHDVMGATSIVCADNPTPGSYQHRLVELSPSVVVEVLSCGVGPTVLFLPAIGLTAPVFYPQFEALCTDWTVIAIHSPGHGRSSVPEKATTVALADTIEGTLIALGITDPVHIVASCFSSVVAQYLAAERPWVVASLTLCGASSEGIAMPAIPPDGLSAKDIARLTEAAAKSLTQDFDRLVEDKRNSHIERHIREACDLLIASQKASPSVGMKYLNEVLTQSPSEWIPRISIPMLFVIGSLDTVVSPDAMRKTASRFSCARVMEIANAGHYPFLTHARTFNSGLMSFLRSI